MSKPIRMLQGVTGDSPAVPPRVAAAQDYLRFADGVRNPHPGFDGTPRQPQDLSAREQVVYDAALEVLRLYFTGEQDFASPPGLEAGGPPADDDPRQPVSSV